MNARLRRLYWDLYRGVTGELPHPRIWHPQWLPQRLLYEGLAPALGELRGEVLDVGCGAQPYRDLVSGRVTGADISPGPRVDVVIAPNQGWPFADGHFDGVLCTQVLEHVEHPATILSEIRRVLRPGGRAVLTAPFIYHEHGTPPGDYRRWSRHGLASFVGRHLTVERVVPQGRVGTLVGTEVLAWPNAALVGPLGLAARGLLFPVLCAFAGLVNVAGAAIDRIDRTGRFYGNVLVVARRDP